MSFEALISKCSALGHKGDNCVSFGVDQICDSFEVTHDFFSLFWAWCFYDELIFRAPGSLLRGATMSRKQLVWGCHGS